jgi:hypothetical protein
MYFYHVKKNSAFISPERARDESLWVVKFEFDIFDSEGIEDRAAYVLRHTIEMMLSVSTRKQQMRGIRSSSYKVVLKQGDIPYFAKASRMAERKGMIPSERRELWTTYSVRGLEGDELFWDIFWIEPGSQFLFGFVGDNDVERSERIADPGAFLRTAGVTRPS